MAALLDRRILTAGKRLARGQNGELGQGLVEYALVMMVVSTALLLSLQGLAGDITDMFAGISAVFP